MTPQVAEGRATAPRTGLVRIGAGLLIGTMAYILPYSAASTVLLPARIAEQYPDDKVALLAVLTGAAAVVALLANVVFGALSDLTRSRFGSRTPWIVGGAVVTALLLIPVSRAGTFLELLVWWCLGAAALNATVAALAAILPDRVPVERRATISAVIGVGILLGSALGAVTGAVFLDDPERGLLVVAVLLVVLAVAAVIVAPDHGKATRPAAVSTSARSPVVPPAAAGAGLLLGLWGRLLLVLGYFMINGFQLYIFTDYVGLDADATARAIGVTSVLFLITALVGPSSPARCRTGGSGARRS